MPEGSSNPENPDSPIEAVDVPSAPGAKAETYLGYPIQENNVGKTAPAPAETSSPDRKFSYALPFGGSHIRNMLNKLIGDKT